MTGRAAPGAGHSAARTLAALLGAPAVALLVGAALAAFLPVAPELAFAVGAHAVVPLWAALACELPLARDGRRAWALCAAVALPLAAALIARGGGGQ